jgi:hypothetical protein
MSDKLGELLVAHNVITDAQLNSALDTQKQIGGKLGIILVKLRHLTEDQLTEFLGKHLNIRVMQLSDLVVYPSVSALVDAEVLERRQVLPLKRTGDALVVAAADPMDLENLDELTFLTGLRVEPAAASRTNILKAIDYYFHGKPCPEIQDSERELGVASGLHPSVKAETRAEPQAVLQGLVELLIEKKLISQEELLRKVNRK